MTHPISIAPLVTFRILFGALMCFGALRFMWNGWIEKLYIEPKFFFKFYGFEWVKALDTTGMYLIYILIAASAFCISIGLFYRIAIVLFFIAFTYVELIDATNYLNHYYLVCLLAFLLIFLPANRAFSFDVWRNRSIEVVKVPAWMIYILMAQLTIVYTCAGIAKLNADWLFHAMPLRAWLLEHTDLPILGYFFQFKETAYLFSWGGAFYDLTIAYFLMYHRTRPFAYILVIIFHLLTYLLFNIGLFPLIMIFSTLIFFPAAFHQKFLSFIGYKVKESKTFDYQNSIKNIVYPLVAIYLIIQIFLPFRHVLYPSHVLWSEEGYRFAWRVMLVEKHGFVTFYVYDPATHKKTEIINGRYLTLFQEKQMSIQPDFILQFAHFLEEKYQSLYDIKNPVVTVDSYVALNGRTSQRFIKPDVDLTKIEDSLLPKDWIEEMK